MNFQFENGSCIKVKPQPLNISTIEGSKMLVKLQDAKVEELKGSSKANSWLNQSGFFGDLLFDGSPHNESRRWYHNSNPRVSYRFTQAIQAAVFMNLESAGLIVRNRNNRR